MNKSTNKLIFVMFQGSGTNLKSWNEDTKSKFLDKLKKLGNVYTYQDKTHNIWYYNKKFADYVDYDEDINFDLSYVKVDSHIKMVYNDLLHKYKNINEYKLVPVGWSSGGFMALYFSQKYKTQCKSCILLDPALFTKNNMKLRLDFFKDLDSIKKLKKKTITSALLKEMQNIIINDKSDVEKNIFNLNDVIHNERSKFFSKHLNLKLSVPTLAFVNIQVPEKKEYSNDFNNKTRIEETKILKKNNFINYEAIILKNATHYIFNKVTPAEKIIQNITNFVSNKFL